MESRMIAQVDWVGSTMEAASSPERLVQLLARRVSSRDLDGLVALYEPEAVFITASGDRIGGRAQLRGVLAELLALGSTVDLRAVQVLAAGETALAIADWSMSEGRPLGANVRESGSSALVLRRQRDGGWLITIDHP